MTKYHEILRLKSLGFSERNIARSCNVSRNTVSKILKIAARKGISWPLNESMTEDVLKNILFEKDDKTATAKRMPNFAYVRKELKRNGVSKKLLWIEYCGDCRMNNEAPLMYSQFCYHIQQNEQKLHATMHIPHKPGMQIEVDWAGDPARIIDPDTGEVTEAWLFVGVMTYSQYAYVEAFINERTKAWITAHIHMFKFFGGVTPMLVPDNCTTAINHEKSDWYTPVLNATYHELAEHYNTAVIPARVRKPKDKPSVEGTVRNISTWITAALRNEEFFSLAELNLAIQQKLQAFNTNCFQKKEGSRLSLFLGEEKPLLAPLPAAPFEIAEWKQATVQFNYHIAVDKMYYSVPYQYIKNKVDVRITESTIEIFHNNERIASHPRLYGRPGMYSTIENHMPENHKRFLEWDGARFRKWASTIGSNTEETINAILASRQIEQQSYRSCIGLLKLADKYSVSKLEKACKQVLLFTRSPSYKSIKNVLIAGEHSTVNVKDDVSELISKTPTGIVRGAEYYGGKKK